MMMVAHTIPPARCNHTTQHQKIAQHVSYTNEREDQAAIVAPTDGKDYEIRGYVTRRVAKIGLPHSSNSSRCRGISRKKESESAQIGGLEPVSSLDRTV
jgi:hypothetical protein